MDKVPGHLSFGLRHCPSTFGRAVCGGHGRNQGSRTKDQGPRTKDKGQGFTLLELSIVMVLLLLLASLAIPAYQQAVQRAREAVLRNDLYTMRSLIDEFTVDKQRPPESLQELVDTGYLRGGVPQDPTTGSSETWQVQIEQVPSGQDQVESGVVDVHSGSDGTGMDGTAYNTW